MTFTIILFKSSKEKQNKNIYFCDDCEFYLTFICRVISRNIKMPPL